MLRFLKVMASDEHTVLFVFLGIMLTGYASLAASRRTSWRGGSRMSRATGHKWGRGQEEDLYQTRPVWLFRYFREGSIDSVDQRFE